MSQTQRDLSELTRFIIFIYLIKFVLMFVHQNASCITATTWQKSHWFHAYHFGFEYEASVDVLCWTEKLCVSPASQIRGHRHPTDCTKPFIYLSSCQFECDAGYTLLPGDISRVHCLLDEDRDSVAWDTLPDDCTGEHRPTQISLSIDRPLSMGLGSLWLPCLQRIVSNNELCSCG